MAMASSATGLGGLVIPFIMTAVNETLGAAWYVHMAVMQIEYSILL